MTTYRNRFAIGVAVLAMAASCVVVEDDLAQDQSLSESGFEPHGGPRPQPIAVLDDVDGRPHKIGYSVAIDGNFAALGAPYDDTAGAGVGAVLLFERIGQYWLQRETIRPFNGEDNSFFGASVALRGKTIAVGAPGRGDLGAPDDEATFGPPGAVYVYDYREGFARQTAVLTADDIAPHDGFGLALAMSADRIVVGAPRDAWHGSGPAAAYVFTREGERWTDAVELRGPSESWDGFGTSLAIEGDSIAVGAPRGDFDYPGTGTVHVYVPLESGWREHSRLGLYGPSHNSDFGAAVAITGDDLFVGAPGLGRHGSSSGAVYEYERIESQWRLERRITPSEARTHEGFGSALAASGQALVVGAPLRDVGTTNTGTVYAYAERSGEWTLRAVLPDGGPTDRLGYSLAVSDGMAVAGTLAGGYAYVYDLGRDDGFACTGAAGCLSGKCIDGVCCASACAGCYACSAAVKGYGADGVCEPIEAGGDPHGTCQNSIPSGGECTVGMCDGAGRCTRAPCPD